MKKRAEKIYNKILKMVVEPLTGIKTTYSDELNRISKLVLGSEFHGVYASDMIPDLTKDKPYAILNLDKTGLPGSHWIAVAKDGEHTYCYDSFGRSHVKIIPSLKGSGNGKIVNTELDAEQTQKEENCGARAIAFLLVFKHWGADIARWI